MREDWPILRAVGGGTRTTPPPSPDGAGLRGAARPVLVRRLGPPDLPAVERHLLALGPEDRQRRFLSRLGDAAIGAYARRLDPLRGILFGALDGPEGELLSLAEAHPAAEPGRVEVAVSVHMPHRGRGLGRCLVARAVAVAFAAGAEGAEFCFDPENRAVVRLIASLGGSFGPGLGQAVVRRDDRTGPSPWLARRAGSPQDA